MISDLLENFETPVDVQQSFITDLKALHLELKHGGYSRAYYLDKIEAFLERNTIVENENQIFRDVLDNDISCKLLQPDGKGWQKGKLKLCFEFIPEETEVVGTLNNSPAKERSPLDEIRNSLAIESN